MKPSISISLSQFTRSQHLHKPLCKNERVQSCFTLYASLIDGLQNRYFQRCVFFNLVALGMIFLMIATNEGITAHNSRHGRAFNHTFTYRHDIFLDGSFSDFDVEDIYTTIVLVLFITSSCFSQKRSYIFRRLVVIVSIISYISSIISLLTGLAIQINSSYVCYSLGEVNFIEIFLRAFRHIFTLGSRLPDGPRLCGTYFFSSQAVAMVLPTLFLYDYFLPSKIKANMCFKGVTYAVYFSSFKFVFWKNYNFDFVFGFLVSNFVYIAYHGICFMRMTDQKGAWTFFWGRLCGLMMRFEYVEPEALQSISDLLEESYEWPAFIFTSYCYEAWEKFIKFWNDIEKERAEMTEVTWNSDNESNNF